LEGRASGSSELRHCLDQGKPGTDGVLRIMFMRLGVAEIGENAVTHILGDEAGIALNQFGAATVIGGNDAS